MKNRISMDMYLGVLIALLSIFTAFAAYRVSVAEAEADELDLIAIKTLIESNTELVSPWSPTPLSARRKGPSPGSSS